MDNKKRLYASAPHKTAISNMAIKKGLSALPLSRSLV